jgi:Domain of unknown function (DUF3291)
VRIAFTTFAILRHPYGHSDVQEFDDRTPDVFLEAENSPGFIDRAKEDIDSGSTNFDRNWGKWGRFCVPRFYQLGRDANTDQRASTLSVWQDIPSVFRFVYKGLHAAALHKRSEWFLDPQWPTYAIWWIPDEYTPQWKEACDKLEQLHDEGPSPKVFNFKRCFDALGNLIDLNSLLRLTSSPTPTGKEAK